MNSYQTLLASFRAKNYTHATEQFRDIMEQKVALRLAEERQVVGKTALCETADQGDNFSAECMECGRKFKSKSNDPKCPKCGGHDIELAN